MRTSLRSAKTLPREEILTRTGLAAAALDALQATHEGSRAAYADTCAAPARDSPAMRAAHEGGAKLASGLTFEAVLGEGGMGIVRLAEQRSVGRKVAVKSVREPHRSSDAGLRLLREAWVTGALEHPNVVPVYDIGVNEEGDPLIVLRRVEGETWSSLIEEPARIEGIAGRVDPLEWHLRTLVQVCHAVDFAHGRGIVHRDIKPSNVMIGRYGEVYLLDWGLATSVRADPSGRFPVAERVDGAGTLAYMAPEMLGGKGASVGVGSDVYLLGATLYEILTGEPPHVADGTFDGAVSSIVSSPPEVSASVPPMMAAVCDKAMQLRPVDRYPSAAAFREAVAEMLAARPLEALVARTDARLAVLASTVAEGGADRALVHGLVGACRLGFHEALRASPHHPRAKDGLLRALVLGATYELTSGAYETALVLADEAEPTPEVTDLRARAREGADAARARLLAMEAEADTGRGRLTRMGGAGALALMWSVLPFVSYLRVAAGKAPIAHELTIASAAHLAVWGWVAHRFRSRLSASRVNRVVVGFGFVIPFSLVLVDVAGTLARLPAENIFLSAMVTWSSLLAAAVALAWQERWVWLGALSLTVATLVAARSPAHRYECAFVGQLGMVLATVLAARAEKVARATAHADAGRPGAQKLPT